MFSYYICSYAKKYLEKIDLANGNLSYGYGIFKRYKKDSPYYYQKVCITSGKDID